ncbi:MAG: DUF3754 domain-containing protein [Gammaproteobacteria bacterium]|nr:DUF3754 domain-containing protein [Gammaproteobacteria bacterium]
MTKEKFIPFSQQDVITMCLAHHRQHVENDGLNEIAQLLSALLHHQYHGILEKLTQSYAPFDPSPDVQSLVQYSPQDLIQCRQEFSKNLIKVLQGANFSEVTQDDLTAALTEESLFKVRLAVDFNDFSQIIFYHRGESIRQETLNYLWGLKKKTIEFTHYDRVAILISFKDASYFEGKKSKLPAGCQPGSTVIKLFQNIPKADLEMLFPNSKIKMRPLDKLIIGGSALIGGTVVLVTKLSASILLLITLFSFWLGLSDERVEISEKQLIALALGMGVFGGFIFKEWSKFKNRKIKFMKALTDSLYYKNMDNNAGVFHTLVNAAETEDVKESVLAYCFLLQHPEGLLAKALDQQIETWFLQQHQCKLDFDISDALQTLTKFNLVTMKNDVYRAINITKGKKALDNHWDNLYRYN